MSTRVQVRELMLSLRDAYPNLFTESDQQWTGRVKRYHEDLGRFDINIVRRACSLAPDRHPDRFPTAGQLVALAKELQDEKKRIDDQLAEARAKNDSDAEERARTGDERANVIPDTTEDQEAWIAEGKNALIRLSRRWSVEAKNKGTDPNATTDMSRCQELFAAIDKVGTFCGDMETETRKSYQKRVKASHERIAAGEREPGDDDHVDLETSPGDDCPI